MISLFQKVENINFCCIEWIENNNLLTTKVVMKMRNLISNFQLFGFTQYEARVYIALLEKSPVTGYELSKNSGVPASKIYQVLNRLKDRNIVLILDGDPARYVPQPPDEVFRKIRQNYLNGLEHLEAELEKIYSKKAPQIQYIWNLNGEMSILDKTRQFIGEAKREIFLSIWEPEYEKIQQTLINVQRSGILVQMVFYGTQKIALQHVYYHGHEEDIYKKRHGRRLALTVDDQRMLIAHFPEEGLATAAWTENPGLVVLTKDYITHDIYTIKMTRKYGQDALNLMSNI